MERDTGRDGLEKLLTLTSTPRATSKLSLGSMFGFPSYTTLPVRSLSWDILLFRYIHGSAFCSSAQRRARYVCYLEYTFFSSLIGYIAQQNFIFLYGSMFSFKFLCVPMATVQRWNSIFSPTISPTIINTTRYCFSRSIFQTGDFFTRVQSITISIRSTVNYLIELTSTPQLLFAG